MAVIRMDNMGIVVEDLDAAIAFFTELGLTLEGRMRIEGDWAGRVTGVRDQRVEAAIGYIRGPEGILIGLAEQLGGGTSRANPMEAER